MKLTKKAGVYNLFDGYSAKDLLNESHGFFKRLFECEKYKKMIRNLRAASESSPSGIVNAVTGNDFASKTIEGVLRLAFPESHNEVWKGTSYGYGLDAKAWEPSPQQPTAEKKFHELVDGKPERYDENTFQRAINNILNLVSPTVRGVKLDFKKTDEELLAQIEGVNSISSTKTTENKRATAALLEQISSSRQKAKKNFELHIAAMTGDPDAPVDASEYFRPGGKTTGGARGVGSGLPGGNLPGGRDQDPLARITACLDKIKTYQEEVRKLVAQKKLIARSENRISDIKEINSRIQMWNSLIEKERKALPEMVPTEGGSTSTDSSGFLHSKPYNASVDIAQLDNMFNIRLFNEEYRKMLVSMQGNEENFEDEDAKLAAFLIKVDKIFSILFSRFEEAGVSEETVAKLREMASLSGNGTNKGVKRRNEEIVDNFEKIKELKNIIVEDLKKVQKEERVLIITNAENTSLRRPSAPTESTLSVFMRKNEDLLQFSKKHKGKCLVFMSQRPLTFEGLQDSVSIVRLDVPVDAQEGMVLVDTVRDELVKRLIGKGFKDALQIFQLPKKDANKIIGVLQGKTHSAAISILNDVFLKETLEDFLEKIEAYNSEMEKPESERRKIENPRVVGISSEKLAKDVARRSNEFFLSRKGDESNGMTLGNPSLEFEDYIYDKDTQWGSTINGFISVFARLEQVNTEIDEVSNKIQLLEEQKDGANSPAMSQLRKRIRELETESNQLYNNLPGFMLLRGDPGVGKSVFVEAFANRLNYTFGKIQMSKTTSGIAGGKEKYIMNFLESLKSMHNAVLLWDEIDHDIAGATSAALNNWEDRANGALQEAFADSNFCNTLKKNRVFILATTNHPEKLERAMRDRFQEETVESPYNAINYEIYLRKTRKIVSRSIDAPLVPGVFSSNEDAWEKAENMLNSINLKRVAQEFEGSGVNFRKMQEWVIQALAQASYYEQSIAYKRMYDSCIPDDKGYPSPERKNEFDMFTRSYPREISMDKNGKPFIARKPVLVGFPWTEDNIVKAASLTKGTDKDESDSGGLSSNGVRIIEQEWRNASEQYTSSGRNWASPTFESDTTQKVEQLKLGDGFSSPRGTEFRPEDKAPRPEPKDRLVVPEENATQEIPDLINPVNRAPSMTVKKPVQEENQQQAPVSPDETKNTDNQKTKSSTDYYVNTLVKLGILSQDEIE